MYMCSIPIQCGYLLSPCRYSKGMGVVGDLLGEDHVLNIPNSYAGLIFFPLMLVLGKKSMRSPYYLQPTDYNNHSQTLVHMHLTREDIYRT